MDIYHLIREAYEAKENSYAPYSGFHVGAALLSSDGAILKTQRILRQTVRSEPRFSKLYRKACGNLRRSRSREMRRIIWLPAACADR